MAITQGITDSFRLEQWKGTHNFATHTFKCALYSEAATLGPDTASYSATNEVTGTGYAAGGVALVATTGYPQVVNGVVYMDWADPVWNAVTISARGALIYNSSASNLSIMVLDFGRVFDVTGQNFTINFGLVLPDGALLRGQ